MFASPSQILCTICGINIYYYGVIMAIAISIGTLYSDWVGTKFFGLKNETIIDLAPYLIIFGILGARLYYCTLNYDFYLRFPTEIIAIRHGGISIHGAILGGAFGLWLFSLRHKISALKLADVCTLGLPLAQAIGRWGNFFNSEAFWAPNRFTLEIVCCASIQTDSVSRLRIFSSGIFCMKVFWMFLIFVLLFFLMKSNKIKKEGNIALIYLILYSVARILVESVRIDSVKYLFGLPVAICVSVGIIILATIILIKRKG